MQIRAYRLLPATGSDGVALRHDISRRGQDQRPGQFDRWVRPIPRMDYCDPMIAGSGDVDRRVYRSRRGDELEIGKALDDAAGQWRSLTHDTDDVKRQQALDHGIWIGKVVLKYGDTRPVAQYRPIRAFKRHALIVVQNSDLVFLHKHPRHTNSVGRFSFPAGS